ncbi:MAG: 5-(carboxyamino)imidazole ribonucleotide mutase [Terriglobia bacterium]
MVGEVSVGVLMGSSSDRSIADEVRLMLRKFGISHEVRVLSAHRNPAGVADYASTAEERGIDIVIAIAGKAAHLAGVCASMTVLPVIGVPVGTSDLGGMDSLFSVVQMPKGVPVATVAVNGGRNAGILAAEILGVKAPAVREKLREFKAELAEAGQAEANSGGGPVEEDQPTEG